MIKDYLIDEKIAARMYIPEGKIYPLVIFAHGLGVNYEDLEHYGHLFEKHGIACLFFDFCGGSPSSKSKGDMWEMSVLSELDDYERVLSFAKTLNNISSITVMGESQGGYVSCLLATTHPEIDGCILWYPGFNIEDFAKRKQEEGYEDKNYLWKLPIGRKYIEDALKVNIYEKMKLVQQDVLILHGTKDTIVPIEYSIKALDYMNATFIPIENAKHGFDDSNREKVLQYCMDYIKRR